MVKLPPRPANTHSPGIRGFVPVRSLHGQQLWGRIEQTQVNFPGHASPRSINIPSTFDRSVGNMLYKSSLLKRSISGAKLVLPRLHSDGVPLNYMEQSVIQEKYRSNFFNTFLDLAETEKELWGPDIIIGWSHTHYSRRDERTTTEQNGKYACLPPVPDKFVVNQLGRTVPWMAPLLSDSRSYGDWIVQYGKFYVRDDMEDDDDVIGPTIAIHRVGKHHFVFN